MTTIDTIITMDAILWSIAWITTWAVGLGLGMLLVDGRIHLGGGRRHD